MKVSPWRQRVPSTRLTQNNDEFQTPVGLFPFCPFCRGVTLGFFACRLNGRPVCFLVHPLLARGRQQRSQFPPLVNKKLQRLGARELARPAVHEQAGPFSAKSQLAGPLSFPVRRSGVGGRRNEGPLCWDPRAVKSAVFNVWSRSQILWLKRMIVNFYTAIFSYLLETQCALRKKKMKKKWYIEKSNITLEKMNMRSNNMQEIKMYRKTNNIQRMCFGMLRILLGVSMSFWFCLTVSFNSFFVCLYVVVFCCCCCKSGLISHKLACALTGNKILTSAMMTSVSLKLLFVI